MADRQPLILASASPRRRELLAYLGVVYRSVANAAEDWDLQPPPDLAARMPHVDLAPRYHPTLLAWRKASTACEEAAGSVIIGADTIVVLDGDVLNKPVDAAAARAMLRRLSGRTHTVYTGVTLIDQRAGASQTHVAIEASQVTIAELSDAAIGGYVATGEPMDKAGAYGIQGLGGRLVMAVEGSYTNVVGLPLPVTHRLLQLVGFTALVAPSEAYRRWLVAQGKEPLPCPPTSP